MNIRKQNSVFWIALVILVALAAWGIVLPQSMGLVGDFMLQFFSVNFGWFYLLVMCVYVAFTVYIALSKYGRIRLGKDTDRPEHSNISWFAMLFSAGMGIGLVFWGVAEPLTHYLYPDGMAGGTAEAAEFAIFSSFFHWGFYPWASYCILALPLAYMQFRKNKGGLISTIFIPLFGEEKMRGPLGKTIDVLAIIATAAGVSTSLGFGVLQINSGLNHLFGVPTTTLVQIIIIGAVTVLFLISAVSGIDRGIKFLSNTNIAICGLLMLIVLIVGPTVMILNAFTNGLGQNISQLVSESLRIPAFGDSSWVTNWRVFYWSWWIAWAPFVGMFIARISKGRTIREFVVGVTLAPAICSCVWFAIFGTTGISFGPEVAEVAIQVTETAYFVIMDLLPFGQIISLVTVVLLFTFFITSADSATFVLGMFSTQGSLNPSAKIKVVWGIIQSLLAMGLMLAGGLPMLQSMTISAAFPFAFVMLLAPVALMRCLREEMGESAKKNPKKEKTKQVKEEKTSIRRFTIKEKANVVYAKVLRQNNARMKEGDKKSTHTQNMKKRAL